MALEDTALEEVVTVGVVQGAEEEEFSRIADVRAAEDGSFFVFDQQVASVGWFDLAGGYLGGIRSRGEGPGELNRPLAIAISSTESLAVLDPGNGRMNLYRFEGGELAYDGQVRSVWSSSLGTGRSLCSVGDRWYVHGSLEGYVIHEVDGVGEVVRSFAEAESASPEEFGPFSVLVVPQLNTGHLLCLEEQGLLVTARPFSSRIQAYTLDGERAWEADLPGIHPRRFVIRDSALGTEGTVEEGSHEILSTVSWTSESILVQYSWRPADGPPGGRDHHSITSVELAASDGSELGRTNELPLVSDVRDAFVYSFENLPYPRVRVLERSN